MSQIISTSGEAAGQTTVVTSSPQTTHHEVVIVGGGTAGITVAAQLTRGFLNNRDVAIIEPSSDHFYQPAWTLVGAGTFSKAATRRSELSVIPKRARWIQDAVAEFDPEHNVVFTRSGKRIGYDYLVVAGGIQINWDGVDGLKDAIGMNGVCSNYSFDTVESTWQAIRDFPKGGTAIFTHPDGPVKCGGAPQKICYLAEDYFRKHGKRDTSRVIFASAAANIFPIHPYQETLNEVVKRKGIETMFRQQLMEVAANEKRAIFKNLDTGEETSLQFDMLHVTPPMGPPAFIASSTLADSAGWVDVDKHTLQHVRYPNVFGLGDSSSLPTSKTGAAIRKQAPVLVKNLIAAMAERPLRCKYDGYTSCPVVTSYGRMMLAEFDYDKNPAETFPFDQSKERWSMWLLKKYGLPMMYWHGMLKGRM